MAREKRQKGANALSKRAKRTAQIKMEVEPRLHRRVKVRAAECGTTITRYVTDLLERQMPPETEKTGK